MYTQDQLEAVRVGIEETKKLGKIIMEAEVDDKTKEGMVKLVTGLMLLAKELTDKNEQVLFADVMDHMAEISGCALVAGGNAD